jgi:hypothetical protein
LQPHYPASFDREVGCTEAEWLMWLPAALGDCRWQHEAAQVRAEVGQGTLDLRWHTLPPRQIALIRLPRLAVSFRFEAVADELRHSFMKRFDLYMQRGGG